MRRGGCARRAMLGAVAAGALLGAARGYDITLDTKANAEPDPRADDEYTVVTTAGLEIVIGPKVGNEYDIASAVPSPNDNDLALSIAVEGGDKPVTDVAGSCPGGITLDASTGDIACYGFAKVDPIPAVGAGSIVPVGASITITPDVAGGFDFTTCEGDIDVQIVAGAPPTLGDIVCKDANGDVAQTAKGATSFTVTDDDSNDVSSTFTLVNCPGGITLDKSENEFVCYGVERGAAPVTNSVGGSIVVTETSEPNAALQEKTTIAGGTIDTSATITVTGGDALASEGTNYKIELDTGDGAFTETVTVSDVNGVPASRTTTVTAPDANDDEKIEDITVTVTEETANPNTPYFPGTDNTVTQTQTVTVRDDIGDITSKTETVDETTTAGSVETKTVTAREYTASAFTDFVEKTKEVTVTVTAPNAEIDDLLSGITGAPDDTFPDSFAAGTVITIVSKSADDSGSLKLETVVVTTELTESGTTTVTDYNIDYSTDEAGILGFIKEIKTEEESVTTTFFLTGDDSLPNPNGGGVNATAGDYLDLFEEELSSSLTVATYRDRLPAGGKLPESFKDGETGEIKGEAILKFEIEGMSYITLFDDPSRLALTANLTTQVSDGTPSRKLLQQEVVAETETEFRSQIDDDDNTEESLKEVEKDAGGNVIRFSANEIKIEEDPKTGFITLTEIETVNGGTEEQVVTENELVLTSIGGSITVVSNKTTVIEPRWTARKPSAIPRSLSF